MSTHLDTTLSASEAATRIEMTMYAAREVGTQTVMPNLVRRDVNLDTLAPNTDQITVSISEQLYDRALTQGDNIGNVQEKTRTNRTLSLFRREAPFSVTTTDMQQLDQTKIMPDAVQEAVRAHIRTHNSRIENLYRDVYNVVGTATTSPFSSDAQALRSCRTMLKGVPKENRFALLNVYDDDRALGLDKFTSGSGGANYPTLETGEIGRKYGFSVRTSDTLEAHVSGTAAGVLANGAISVGATQAAIDTGTGTLNYGDIITWAGHTQTYVVGKGAFASVQNADDKAQGTDLDYTSVADVSSAIVTFQPPLVAAVADNAAMTVIASHNVSLAFQQNAFVFAPRKMSVIGDYKFVETLTDPVSQASATLQVKGGHNQEIHVLSTYFGIGTLYPHFATRIIGTPNV